MKKSTVIVGAGIIGSYCALQLAEAHDPGRIMIVDRQPFTYDNASCTNIGGFATCEVRPLASLHNIWRAIKWLPNPRAPLALRLRYLPGLLPWLRVFLKSAVSRQHFDNVVRAQQSLMKHASSEHLERLNGTGLENLISQEGAICLYKNEKRLAADWNSRWRLFREQGFDCYRLSTDELRAELPDLNSRIQHAIHVPDIHYWKEPQSLLSGLHELLRERGIDIRPGEVTGIRRGARSVAALTLSDEDELPFGCLIVAAGAWSKSLCRELGDNVPLDTERGYCTSLPNAGVSINHLLLLVEDDFVATPMHSGLRLGGTVELAGLDAAPNFSRTALMANQIRAYFPDINTDGRTNMIGFRPSVPDGLPVISRASKFDNAFFAFGHGHVGVTQSAITGKLIAQLITGENTDIDLGPFSVGRFS